MDKGGTEDDNGLVTRQCTSVGQEIEVLSSTGAAWTTYNCQAQDLVVPGNRRYDVLRQRQEWATWFWGRAVSVKRTQDPIGLSTAVASRYRINATSLAHPDTDLVIIMLARPSPFLSVAAYAQCLQTDQYSRCTVGVVNTVPAILDVGQSLVRKVISSERQTAAHEVAHLLGAVRLGPHWINATNGFPADVNSYAVYEPAGTLAYPKPMVRIASPRVLSLARKAFGCPTLTGVPLEDLPLGAAVHWESRVLGPEFMSYGSSMGEEYVSDITLAMLEDSNQFVANYSMAGALIEALDTPLRQSSAPTLLAASQESSYEAPEPYPPGMLRWGRSAGCDFVDGSPVSWPEHYVCQKQGESGCTPDNRAGAVCTLRFGVEELETVTCAKVTSTTRTNPDGHVVEQWSVGCESTNDNCADGSCAIPSMYQYFGNSPNAIADFDTSDLFPNSDTTGAMPGNTGGASAAMDYLPVRIKYWNCGEQATVISQNNRTSQESVVVDGSIFADRADLVRNGGQEHCKNCRCFRSSLLQFNEGISFGSKLGMCYRANCYRSDYLQVGVKGFSSGLTNWYACPRKGGSLLIAGYTGSLECPAAETFCVQENISGIRYAENSSILEWILLGITLTVVLMGLFILFFPCLREPCVLRMKQACAVHQFDENREILLYGKDLYDDERSMWEPDEVNSSWVRHFTMYLTVANVLVLIMLTIVISISFLPPESGVPLSALTLVLLFVGALGYVGARGKAQGASCAAISFVFMGAMSALLVVVSVFTTGLGGIVDPEEYMDRNWENVCDFLHNGDDKFCTETLANSQLREESIEEDKGTVVALISIASVLAIVYAGVLVAAVTRAARMIHSDVLIAVAFASSAYFMATLGFIMVLLFSFALHTYDGPLGAALFGTLLVLGFVVLFVALAALWGVWKMNHKWLLRQFIAVWIMLPVALAIGITLLVLSDDVAADVRGMSDSEAASAAEYFGLQGISQESFAAFMKDLFENLGIGALIIFGILVFRVISSILFRRELRIFLADRSARVARQERRLRAMGFSAHFAESRDAFDIRFGFAVDTAGTPSLSAADRTESWHASHGETGSSRSLAASKASAHSASIASIARMVASLTPGFHQLAARVTASPRLPRARRPYKSLGQTADVPSIAMLDSTGEAQLPMHRTASDGEVPAARAVRFLPQGSVSMGGRGSRNDAVAAGSAFPLGRSTTPVVGMGSAASGYATSAHSTAVGSTSCKHALPHPLHIHTGVRSAEQPLPQTSLGSVRSMALLSATQGSMPFQMVIAELRHDTRAMRSRMDRPLALLRARHRPFVQRTPAAHWRRAASPVGSPRAGIPSLQPPHAARSTALSAPSAQSAPFNGQMVSPSTRQHAAGPVDSLQAGKPPSQASFPAPQASPPPPAPGMGFDTAPPDMLQPSLGEQDIPDSLDDDSQPQQSLRSVHGLTDLGLNTNTNTTMVQGSVSLASIESSIPVWMQRSGSLHLESQLDIATGTASSAEPVQVIAAPGSPFRRAQGETHESSTGVSMSVQYGEVLAALRGLGSGAPSNAGTALPAAGGAANGPMHGLVEENHVQGTHAKQRHVSSVSRLQGSTQQLGAVTPRHVGRHSRRVAWAHRSAQGSPRASLVAAPSWSEVSTPRGGHATSSLSSVHSFARFSSDVHGAYSHPAWES